MTLRLLCAIVAVILGLALLWDLPGTDPEVLAGLGIVLAALAAVLDR